MRSREHFTVLEKYGSKGVAALRAATPVDSSETADGWSYEIISKPGYFAVVWRNSHLVNGTPVAILLQYGHATRNGGYVQGRDFINPAIQPIFDQMAAEMWRVVKK